MPKSKKSRGEHHGQRQSKYPRRAMAAFFYSADDGSCCPVCRIIFCHFSFYGTPVATSEPQNRKGVVMYERRTGTDLFKDQFQFFVPSDPSPPVAPALTYHEFPEAPRISFPESAKLISPFLFPFSSPTIESSTAEPTPIIIINTKNTIKIFIICLNFNLIPVFSLTRVKSNTL